MPKLFVAGDSFACLAKSQQEGISWSEIVAKELNYGLINLSRPGSSNETISMQIDYISECVSKEDFVIVFLTDSFRKTFPKANVGLSEKHLLRYHSLHDLQKCVGEDIFDSDPSIDVFTYLNASTDESKFYFKNLYNYDFHKYIDRTLLTGACAKLKLKTNKFVVFSGGFNDEVYSEEYPVDAKLFCLDNVNFYDFSSSKILKLARDEESINHISELGHKKVARIVLDSIMKCK
jgi:hypothetical protein